GHCRSLRYGHRAHSRRLHWNSRLRTCIGASRLRTRFILHGRSSCGRETRHQKGNLRKPSRQDVLHFVSKAWAAPDLSRGAASVARWTVVRMATSTTDLRASEYQQPAPIPKVSAMSA
ncbi:unnamed protein product, partial [Ixodes persulcatus]